MQFCRYRYYSEQRDEYQCCAMEFELCPYSWYCTNDHIYKDHEGLEHCGLLKKNAQSDKPLWLVKEWQGDIAICFNGTPDSTVGISCPDDGNGKPAAVRTDSQLKVVERIYHPDSKQAEPKAEQKELPKKAKQYTYKNYIKE